MREITSSVLALPTDLARLGVLETAVAGLLSLAPPLEDAEIVQYNVWLATHELCVNIIEHAYAGESGQFTLTFRLLDDPLQVEITSSDQGKTLFDFDEWSPPDLSDPPIHGLGIFLIRQLMDHVAYAHTAAGTCWQLVKNLTPASNHAAQLAPAAGGKQENQGGSA